MSGILQQRLPGFIERLPIGPKGKLWRYRNEYLYDFSNSPLMIFVRILARRCYCKEMNVVTAAPNSRLQVSEKTSFKSSAASSSRLYVEIWVTGGIQFKRRRHSNLSTYIAPICEFFQKNLKVFTITQQI